MHGTVTFHPVDLQFFDEMVQPLVARQKINPQSYLDAALRLRSAAWAAARYVRALEDLLEQVEPPPVPPGGKLWDRMRARLEQFDHRPDKASILAAKTVEPELHLEGRPFLITEGSADRVSSIVDEYLDAASPETVQTLILEQLIRLHPQLGRSVTPSDTEEPSSDFAFKRDLLDGMRELYDLSGAAERGDNWGKAGGSRRPAAEVLSEELPYRAMVLYSRATPFWVAREVDGLEAICRAAGISPPACLVPAWRLFGDACEAFPGLRETIRSDLKGDRSLGAYVSADDIEQLLEFLGEAGSRIIKAATRAGEGATCATPLRKIRECATYAAGHGMGYLEASGIPPLGMDPDEDDPAD